MQIWGSSCYPQTCRTCWECMISSEKKKMSAALLITALVRSDDQQVTGNTIFTAACGYKSRNFYMSTENVPALKDCWYQWLVIYSSLIVKSDIFLIKKKGFYFSSSLRCFHFFDSSCAAAPPNHNPSQCVSSCVNISCQTAPTQQIAATVFQRFLLSIAY